MNENEATTAAPPLTEDQETKLRQLLQAHDTIEYIASVLKENVIHGEEAFKTVGALQWLEALGNGVLIQAQLIRAQAEQLARQQAAQAPAPQQPQPQGATNG